MGCWLIMCLSSNSKCEQQRRANDFASLAWPLIKSSKVNRALEGDSGDKGRSYGLGRDRGRRRGHGGSKHKPEDKGE